MASRKNVTNYYALTGARLTADYRPSRAPTVTPYVMPPQRFATPRTPIRPETSKARYLGLIFFALVSEAGWTYKQAKHELGITMVPSISGFSLVGPLRAHTPYWMERLENRAGRLFNRYGFGNVLHAYARGQDIEGLMDPDVLALATQNITGDEKKEKMRELCGLPKKVYRTPSADWRAYHEEHKDRYSSSLRGLRVSLIDEEPPLPHGENAGEQIPAQHSDDRFEDVASPVPIVPDNISAAIAQELLLQSRKNAARWEDMRLIERILWVEKKAATLKPDEITQNWRQAAHGLLGQLSEKPVDAAQPLMPCIEKLVDLSAATPPRTAILRRLYHLGRFAPDQT